MSPDRDEARYKRVVVRQDGDHVHEEHIVRDANLENRQFVYKFTQLLWLMFGLLEALIGFRIFLKLIAANPANWFTAFVYQLTDIFLWPFQGITANPSLQGFVLEISSFIAMLVYALVAWALVRLSWLLLYHRAASRVTTYDRATYDRDDV
jgi:uncharacterized protein YggT (Ycf19 family)